MKLLSIVFSFKNEQENINELVRRVNEIVNKKLTIKKYELIFVDDCSSDDSLQVLLKLKKKYPIKIIRMSRTFGVTPCVLAGFKQSKGDAVIYMDCDLQDPPELLPLMVDKFLNGADVVHTIRTKRHGESFFKLLITKIAYKTINFFSEVPLVVNAGDFKLLSRRAVEHILSINESDPYMRGLSVWIGFNQCFLNYERNSRYKGKTHFSLLSNLNPVNEFLRGLTAFSVTPLYITFGIGFFGLFISIIIIIYALITKFLGVASPGSSSILIVMGLLFSINILSIGILGIYVARIYNQVKTRPRYIIDKIY